MQRRNMMLLLGVLTAGFPSDRAEGRGDPLAGWSTAITPNPGVVKNALLDVHAIDTNNVWAVGYLVAPFNSTQALAIHWDGTSWTHTPTPAVEGLHSLQGVGGSSASDIWAVGWKINAGVRETLIMHYDGQAWSIVPSPNPHATSNELNAVVAISPTDAWAVGVFGLHNAPGGQSPLALHWNGTQWQVSPVPAIAADLVEHLNSVDAIAPDNVWAVGTAGLPDPYDFLLLHYDGVAWQHVGLPQPGDWGRQLQGIDVIAPDLIWIAGFAVIKGAGEQGIRLLFDGTTWQDFVQPCQFPCSLWDIDAGQPWDVLATGHREYGPAFSQGYRSPSKSAAPGPWTYLNFENIDSGGGPTRGCTVLPSGEAWVVGWRDLTGGYTHTRVYHYVPKGPNMPADITGDGAVNVADLLALINAWGPCPAPPAACTADIAPGGAPDGEVNVNDLLMVINNWG